MTAILARVRGAALLPAAPRWASVNLRRLAGWGVVLAGGGLLAVDLFDAVMRALASSPALVAGVTASALAGLATGAGALAVPFMRGLSRRGHDALLGASAGVMLAAAVFSLLLPAMEAARALFGAGLPAAALTGASLAAGGAALLAIDRVLPHVHFVKDEGLPGANAGRGLHLIVLAIALHNVPEGLAVGASYAGGEGLGLATALGIGLQNMPEGLVVAAALAMLGHSARAAIAVATATGLIEPFGALLGGVLAGVADLLLPITLAFAGGAMLFVISHEMVPESHRSGNEGVATSGLLAGFVLMMGLAQAL